MMRNISPTVRILVPTFSFLVIVLLLQNYAKAEALDHPYIGMHIEGYQSALVSGRTSDPVRQITGYTDFAGASPSYLNPDLLSMVTTTGWIPSSNTITAFQYQFPIQAKNNGLIYSDPQIWNLDTPIWNCYSTNSCPVLGAHSQVQYVYYSMDWNAGKTQVNFYAEAHLTGNVIQSSYQSYIRNTSIDPSQDFSAGVVVNSNTYGAKVIRK